jgi:uncharacterized ferritin-like protein (DUF455 family)
MSDTTDGLFADSPARDARFDVKDKWIDCPNLPGDHPDHQLEFFQRQMNEEINSIESSARCLVDFPNADWEVRLHIARQCSDEATHAVMFRNILENRGGYVGQFPVLNFQYRIISNCPTLAGRLAIQNRSFEAGGIDAILFGIGAAREAGDDEIADMYEAQLADEINHVRFANEWLRQMIARSPRTVLEIGTALTSASRGFAEVMGSEGTEGVVYPINVEGRLDAGFTEAEVQLDIKLQSAKA